VPGKYNNHPIARIASRRHYGELLSGGVKIFEYWQRRSLAERLFATGGIVLERQV
jgi:hypothetical protein